MKAARWLGVVGGVWLIFNMLALVATVGLAGAKVMVDEIARETPLGTAAGEWVILYICLTFQLAYILAFLVYRRPLGSKPGSEP